MAGKLNLEIKVGIFSLIALIILMVAVFSISEVYIFRPGYQIKVDFSFASSLNVGALVRVAGVEAGEIKDISLSYDEDKGRARVRLSVWLRQGVKVPQDSVAYVNMLGLVGENYLEIVPGEDYEHPLKEGDVLVGRDPLSTETLMETAHKVAGNLDDVLISIRSVLDAETRQALKETISNFHAVSEDIKVITGRLERGEGKLGAWLKVKQSSKRKPKTKERKPSRPKQNF